MHQYTRVVLTGLVLHILVVDDDPSCARLLERALRRLGHDAEIALHPDDALEMLRSGGFDAVITDIDMPGMNGVELARQIRTSSDVPIAFCTGSTRGTHDLVAAAEYGAVFPKVSRDPDVAAVVDELRRH